MAYDGKTPRHGDKYEVQLILLLLLLLLLLFHFELHIGECQCTNSSDEEHEILWRIDTSEYVECGGGGEMETLRTLFPLCPEIDMQSIVRQWWMREGPWICRVPGLNYFTASENRTVRFDSIELTVQQEDMGWRI